MPWIYDSLAYTHSHREPVVHTYMVNPRPMTTSPIKVDGEVIDVLARLRQLDFQALRIVIEAKTVQPKQDFLIQLPFETQPPYQDADSYHHWPRISQKIYDRILVQLNAFTLGEANAMDPQQYGLIARAITTYITKILSRDSYCRGARTGIAICEHMGDFILGVHGTLRHSHTKSWKFTHPGQPYDAWSVQIPLTIIAINIAAI